MKTNEYVERPTPLLVVRKGGPPMSTPPTRHSQRHLLAQFAKVADEPPPAPPARVFLAPQ